jgi:HEAT repeat protein
MWHFRHFRHSLTAAAAPGALLAALLLAPARPAQAVPPQDPVEELRRDLRYQPGSDAQAIKYREDILTKRIDALTTLADLRRALALTEWKFVATEFDEVSRVDAQARQKVGEKFRKGVKAVIARGDALARIAVADMLGEMGAEIRSLTPKDNAGFGRSMTPELIQLTKDRDPSVRAAAARALGKIFPDPKTAAKEFKRLLDSGGDEQHLGAAQGLVNMIQTVAALQKTGRAQTGVEATGADVLDASRWVIEVAPPGMTYSNPRVRELTLDAVQRSLQAFREQIPEPFETKEFAPPDRQITPQERKKIVAARERVREINEQMDPIVKGVRKLARPLVQVLEDSDPAVRLAARKALESVGEARLRLKRLESSVPALPGEKGVKGAAAPLLLVSQKGQEEIDDLSKAVEPGLLVIARGVSDPDPRIRLAAVEFLESLEDAAAPAVPVLVSALSDPNRFVRWAAGRAFAKMGPVRVGVVVPALACLLRDSDVDVAKQAANTLESYADDAAPAVPALAQAAALADPEVRVAAMNALSAVGKAAAPAVPALVTALGHRDAEVRKTAAETLGKIGPNARDAVSALRVALRDDNPTVRRAASDAILSILTPAVK